MIRRLAKKHSKKFALFLAIGIVKTILTIFLSWILIDMLKFKALAGSTLVVVIVFFITYFLHRLTKVIKPAFVRYTSATFFFNLLTIAFVWVLVDFGGFSGALSSAIVAGTLFILRYVFFSRMGLILYE
jgi:putative flippase GtrA